MNSLVKADVLCGVEIWGWKRREGIEKLQVKLIKMVLGLRNSGLYLEIRNGKAKRGGGDKKKDSWIRGRYFRNGQMVQNMPERRNPGDDKQEPVTVGEGI